MPAGESRKRRPVLLRAGVKLLELKRTAGQEKARWRGPESRATQPARIASTGAMTNQASAVTSTIPTRFSQKPARTI